jgi:hypothetical protein
VSRNKKKKRIAGQNLSLSERLERHWKGERWEAFLSLYMRDREASDRGPWAVRFPDAQYNCLTSALFLHKSIDGTRQIAEMMLSERSLGPDDGILRLCARTALDFINIREGRSSCPTSGEGCDITLPSPYEELRRKLADEFAPLKPKRGRKGRAASNPTLEKLSKQFKALPAAKNNGPYSSFLKTTDALLLEMEGTDSAVIFKAVRDIASIMREVAAGVPHARNPAYLVHNLNSAGYPLRAGHPALFTLWEYMCELGGRKFGGGWENAARAARMSLISLNEEFKPAYDRVMVLRKHLTGENLTVTAERYYNGWTEQERFILIFLTMSELLKKGGDPFEDVPINTVLRWFKTISDIGGRRRSGGAWPMNVRLAFEKLATAGEIKRVNFLAKEDLPFECMTTPTIIAIIIYDSHSFGRMKKKLGPCLPLSIDKKDRKILSDFFSWMVFPIHALRAVCELFDRREREILFTTIVMSIIREDMSRALGHGERGATMWDSLSQSHIALFVENLPEDSQIAALCRLCLGQKSVCLSDDPSKIAAFFSSRQDEDFADAATLSLFLMLWPGVSVEFLLRLFEDSLKGHERINNWEAIPKIVSMVQSPENRKKISRGISLILKRSYKNKMSASLKLAIKDLDTLEKGSGLPGNNDNKSNTPGNFDGEKDLLDMFQRIISEAEDGRGPFKKQGQTGPKNKKGIIEKLRKLLFQGNDDDD